MQSASMYIEKSFRLGTVDGRLYSSFIEHLGRAVYTGIYEPGHPEADEQGFRRDVLKLVRELGVDLVRYPGGNFLSGYRWTDGIGPPEERPRRLDLAWRTIESNRVGIDEFADWAKKAGVGVMGAVNMGTGTPQEAGDLLEYCNFPSGTAWSDLRIRNGHRDPHNIKVWCVGNEMDGPWQICHLNASDYGKKALETMKIMKWVDPSIELVVCGSATSKMPTYPEWDRIVLEHTYEAADYLSLHRYYENEGSDLDFLASFVDMDNFIHSVCAAADYVKALKRSKKTMMLSFDEWNVWYQKQLRLRDWEEAPPILEDRYSLLDALVFGGLGITLINNSDRVRIACLAQLVNVIAPIFTEKNGRAIRQTIYHPFRLLSRYGRGEALKPVVICPETETSHGGAPLLNACALYREEAGELCVFALNIADEELRLSLNGRSFGALAMEEHIALYGGDMNAVNTFDHPDAVQPRSLPVQAPADILELVLPARSWHVMRFKV
ncbi:MAG: alpha-N-arabinofuranosidase [Oscillospiraceae bacterium]|nr:alpha-N-arabinofuranosidase [Oscillospiraceae bacterium]